MYSCGRVFGDCGECGCGGDNGGSLDSSSSPPSILSSGVDLVVGSLLVGECG